MSADEGWGGGVGGGSVQMYPYLIDDYSQINGQQAESKY